MPRANSAEAGRDCKSERITLALDLRERIVAIEARRAPNRTAASILTLRRPTD